MQNTFFICFRVVEYTQLKDIEIFVAIKDGNFQLPTEIPTRFLLRIEKQFVKNVVQIKSSPFDTTTLTNHNNLQETGLWITKNDYKEVGNVKPAIFGIPLHEHIRWAFDVTKTVAPFESKYCVYVGYHGTGLEQWKSIQKENSLRCSLGQLGYGLYVGSFWKACRFAGRDQDYKFRENPIVLRILWCGNPNEEIQFPRKNPCTCKERCESNTLEIAQACAHDMVWNSTDAYGFLKPTQMSNGKWITKNEEWIFSPLQLLRVAEAVELQKDSIDKPHYNPWQRNIKII